MNTVTLTKSEFDELGEYSHSLPTGTTIGKRWKAKLQGPANWWMGEYTRELPIPTCCRYHRCIVGVVDERPCHAVQTAEGVVFDPKNPEAWHERPNRQVEIKWSKITVLPAIRSSRKEDDPICFGDNTGWFINAPNDRNTEVAAFLGMDKVYCVGVYPRREVPDVVFVQRDGHLDERNGKVEYVVVQDKVTIKGVMSIIMRKLSRAELDKARVEDAERMDLARDGRL